MKLSFLKNKVGKEKIHKWKFTETYLFLILETRIGRPFSFSFIEENSFVLWYQFLFCNILFLRQSIFRHVHRLEETYWYFLFYVNLSTYHHRNPSNMYEVVRCTMEISIETIGPDFLKNKFSFPQIFISPEKLRQTKKKYFIFGVIWTKIRLGIPKGQRDGAQLVPICSLGESTHILIV